MSKWEFLKVKDLVFDESIEKPLDGNHGNLHPKGEDFLASGIPFIMASDIQNSKIDLKGCKFISESQARSLRKGFAKTGDVLLTHKATLGRTAIVPKLKTDFIILTPQVTYYRIKNKHRIDNNYLKYYFDTPDFQKTIQNHGDAGSTRAYIGITAQYDLPVILPPFKEQKAIASVLSSLDDKIDLLHRQNKTLESMAETLFRQWFIEEAQDKWLKGTLNDEFHFVMGQSPSGASFNEDFIGIPMYQGNADFGFRFPTPRVFTTEPTRYAEAMDTLISVRAPVGAQNMASQKCCIGRGVAAFRHKTNPEFYTYTYFKLRELMGKIKHFNDEGTVFGSISKSDFEKIEIIIPPHENILAYEKMAKPVNDKIIKNCYQISKIEKLRDTLLPKLVSGEVRVKYTK